MSFVDKLSQNEAKTSSKIDKLKELHELEKKEATEQNKPWVNVLNTHVNENDIKNGFFELDWNDIFIEVLLDEGYIGESQEEIVEKWFNTIIANILNEEGYEPDSVNSGNVVNFLKNE